MNLDIIDYQVLDGLQADGRMKRSDLAEKVNLSLPALSERLRKLETEGYIVGYAAKLNRRVFGKDITAFVIVTIDSSKHFPSFVEHAEKNEEILECHAITGEGTHIVKVRTDNTASLERLLAKIQSWPGVVHTRTSIVLSSQKETFRIKLPIKPNSPAPEKMT
jgi:Lrp/AsnC family leucine-responsive transcriptional regulator